MSVHFFTGFPGFITSQLIRELFRKKSTSEAIVLVLQTEWEKSKQEAEKILEEFPNCTIQLIEGDITYNHLKIEENQLNELKEKINVFWHLAAIYDLAVPKEIAWKVNVEGTRMVRDFLLTLPNLERFMYFSTAYVAGMREGNLLETELIRPKHFKNYYEETKFEAELLIEEIKENIPLTIIRPGIVRGHSETGETIKFDGPYFFLNMIDRLKWLPFIPYIGQSSSTINVVPIDYILNACTFLWNEDEAAGKTLHLTDPKPHPVQEVYRMMVKGMTGKFPKGKIPLSLTKIFMRMKSARRLLGVEKETLDYLTWNASFDCRQAHQLLVKGGITCPEFIATLPSMIKFYNEHKGNQQYHIEIK